MNLKQQLPLILITFLGLFCLNTEAKTTATVCAIIGDSTVCENDVESSPPAIPVLTSTRGEYMVALYLGLQIFQVLL
jgi:hypothetical protein